MSAGEAKLPMISVQDLWKSFGDNHVLTGINLDVEEGRTVVILGGSGSGKTVLMKHMIGLLKPDRGKVFVDGEDIVPLDEVELERVRRKFGMVFQGAALFDSMTVYENVSFPLREHTDLSEEQIRAKVREKLAIVGLQGVEERYPAELSGGMRKRVGLARAIVRDPKIVLYDEPTTGLDPITTDYVDDMILTAKRELDVTQVVISHDIASSFKVADKVAFLFKGRIVAQGPPQELRHSQHPELKHFLQMWFGKS
jgi:ABC-type transport system involved in resistance to organic solvents, ATPase component